MPSVVHRLGELEHIYDKHNLKLRTTGCITLSSPQPSDRASSLDVEDLDTLISSGTWIAGGHRLLFHVELLFDDIAVSGSSVSQATEDVGIVLCNAELWSQLCLDTSLTVDNPNTFLISLSAEPSSKADITPPKRIPSTYIEDIRMLFHLSTCRRTKNASRAPFAISGSDMEHTAASTYTIDENLDCRYYSPLLSLGGSLNNQMDRYASRTLVTSSIGASPVSSQNSVSSNTHSTSSLNTSTNRDTYATQEVEFEVLIQLVDFSLRRMMSDYKQVRPGGVVLSGDAGCQKLATISPALFSPGYVKALSQRTALLPTIAGTVSRVYRRTHSSPLRHKLQRLQEVSLCNGLNCSSSDGPDSSGITFSSFVEERLWFLTRSKLVDPLACRGLKSLSTSNRVGFGSDRMLDESLDDAGNVMLGGDEALTFDACGDAMELDIANPLDLSQEHYLNEVADEEEDPLDDDLFWEHSQHEIA